MTVARKVVCGIVKGFFKAYFTCQKIFAHLILTKPPKPGNIWNAKQPLYKV